MLRSQGGNPGLSAPLFVLRSANMQLDTDQTFTKMFTGTRYVVTNVIGARKTGGTTVACAGGIYDAASKGGNALIADSQDWVALSGAGKVVKATLAAILNTDSHSATPILSLTTGSTAACTADIFIYGFVVD